MGVIACRHERVWQLQSCMEAVQTQQLNDNSGTTLGQFLCTALTAKQNLSHDYFQDNLTKVVYNIRQSAFEFTANGIYIPP